MLQLTEEQLAAIHERQKAARTVDGRDARDERDMKLERKIRPLEERLASASQEALQRNAKRLASIPRMGAPERGKSRPRGVLPTEHQTQVAFFSWARPYLRSKGIDPRLLYAVPNSQILMGKRSPKERAMIMSYLKAEGFTPGIPDIHLDVPLWSKVSPLVCTFHGLRLELKKKKGGKAHPEQLEIIELLRRQGYNALIVEGYEEAERALRGYVELI